MKKTDLKISIFLGLISFAGGFLALQHQIKIISPEQVEELLAGVPFSWNVLMLVTALQMLFFGFLLSFVGLKLARKTGFSLNILEALFNKTKVIIDKKSTFIAIISGVVLGLIIIGADRFYYQYQIPMLGETKPEFSFLGLMAGIVYGGVFEEILMRLFFMSLTVWIFMKILKRDKESISSLFYLIAIILSAVLFAAGHLPVTETVFEELTNTLVVRSFLLNGIGGLVFGYLYWKKGFEYAVLAHMFAHISMQLIFIPIFY